MASSRPSGFKKAGGFLNNVDGEIAGYEFTPDFPSSDGKQRKNKESDFNPLYFILRADVDGQEKQQETTMLAGSADDFEISDDGLTLTPVDENVGLRQNTPFYRFLETLVASGFDDTRLPDDGEPINYEGIIGTRARFAQEVDEKSMEKAAKNWRKSNGKFNERGQKKGKDGKYYDQTRTIIAEVYSMPDEAPTTTKGKTVKGKTGAASTGKNVKAANGKANGKAVDLDELAAETLKEILSDNEGSIAKSKLPGRLATKLGPKHPHREELRKLIYSDDFLATENGWTYDQSSKNQTIELS